MISSSPWTGTGLSWTWITSWAVVELLNRQIASWYVVLSTKGWGVGFWQNIDNIHNIQGNLAPWIFQHLLPKSIDDRSDMEWWCSCSGETSQHLHAVWRSWFGSALLAKRLASRASPFLRTSNTHSFPKASTSLNLPKLSRGLWFLFSFVFNQQRTNSIK